MEVNGHAVGTYWHHVTSASHYGRLQAELRNHKAWLRGVRPATHFHFATHSLCQEPAMLHERMLQDIPDDRLKKLICCAWDRHGYRNENGEFPVLDQFKNEYIMVALDKIHETIESANRPLEAQATVRQADMLHSACEFRWFLPDAFPVWDIEGRLTTSYLHLLSGQRSTFWHSANTNERIVVVRGNCSVAIAVANAANLQAYSKFNDNDDPIALFKALNPVVYNLLTGDILHFWPGTIYIIIAEAPLVLWRTRINYGQTIGAQLASMQANVTRGSGTPARYGKKIVEMFNIYKWDLGIVERWSGNIGIMLPNHCLPLREAVRVLAAPYNNRYNLTDSDFAEVFNDMLARSANTPLPLDEPNVLKRLLNVEELADEQGWVEDHGTKSTVPGFRKFVADAKSSQCLAKIEHVWAGAPHAMLLVKMFFEMLRLLCLRGTKPIDGYIYPCMWLAMRTRFPRVEKTTREVRDIKNEMADKILTSPMSQVAEEMLADIMWQPVLSAPDGINMLVKSLEDEENGAIAKRTRAHGQGLQPRKQAN